MVTLIVLLAATASGLGFWYAVRAAPAAHQSAIAMASSTATSPPASPPTTSAPPPSPSPPAPSPSDTLVALAPPAAGYPDAAAIQPVIAEYFRAINSRDYAGYLTTQACRRGASASPEVNTPNWPVRLRLPQNAPEWPLTLSLLFNPCCLGCLVLLVLPGVSW